MSPIAAPSPWEQSALSGPFRLAWRLLLAASILLGVYAWRYALPRPFGLIKAMSNNQLHPWGMAIHAVIGSLAMMIAPLQLSQKLRQTRPRLHRWLGRIYLADVGAAWLASLILAPSAASGAPAAIAFFIIGALWVGATALGFLAIRRADVATHRRWMTRSAAYALAPITIHVYALIGGLQLSVAKLFYSPPKIPFEAIYPVGLWLTLATNIALAEWFLRRRAPRLA